MRKFHQILSTMMLGLLLTACDHPKPDTLQSSDAENQTIIVTKHPSVNHLYFQGTIAPIRVTPITTPLEGIVEAKSFNYGDQLTQNQALFRIKSDAFEKEYQSALSEYLKAQENYATNTDKARSSKELWQAGLIARNDYQAQINAAADSSLGLKLAQQKLFHLLKTGGVLENTSSDNLFDKLKNLAITDIDAVNNALKMDVSHIKIRSPRAGIALIATQHDRGQSSNPKEIVVGTSVKPQDALALIGDMSGIKIAIKVNEIDVNHLKIGQTATVTGSAFPGIHLQGKIATLNTQASDEGAGSLPTFPVTIVVDKISTEQQQKIHVGMSAQVQITLNSNSVISVPIDAVHQQGNEATVLVLDPDTQQTKRVKVKTGKTSLKDVIILEGLQEGDHIVIDYPTP